MMILIKATRGGDICMMPPLRVGDFMDLPAAEAARIQK